MCREGKKDDLVIIVKSALLDWQARSAFRSHIYQEKLRNKHLNVGIVFSVGMPRKSGGRNFYRDGHLVSLQGKAGDLLEIYEGREKEVMDLIHQEINTFDDIILADYEDTYYNLSWKSVTNFRWMSAFCRPENVEMFLIIDVDHRVNLTMYEKFLQRVPRSKRRNAMFGYVADKDTAYRSPKHKLFLSYKEFPWDLMQPYLRGFAQLVGPNVVDDMAIATAYTRHNYCHEDVFLGLTAFKLGIPIYNEATMYDHEAYEEDNKELTPAMVAMAKYFEIVRYFRP